MKWCPVRVCCAGNLEDKDDDLELLHNCFGEASNFSESERSTVYYICGYVSFNGVLYLWICFVQRCIIFVDMFRLTVCYICGYMFRSTVYYICGYVSLNGMLYLWICFV